MLKGLGNLGDMAKMMKAAQEMQGKMAEAQEALDRITVTGEAGTGLVTATATAKGELVGLEHRPDHLQPEREGSRRGPDPRRDQGRPGQGRPADGAGDGQGDRGARASGGHGEPVWLMAGLLSFSRDDAVALPLTSQTVDTVIARTRRVNLVQMGLSVSLVAGLVVIGRSASGWVSGVCYAVAALAMWGILATVLSTWDHFRAAAPLRRQAQADIARDPDPKRFWWAHRGVFPHFSR